MYVSRSRLRVPEERSDELVRALRNRARLVEDADDRIDPGLQADIRLQRLEHLHTYEVVAE